MASTYTPIATTTATGSATSITFNSIPSTYTDLILIASATGTSSAYLGYIIINGDGGSNYSETLLYGTGSTAGSARESNRAKGYAGNWTTQNSTTSPTVFQIHFQNYSNTNVYKTFIGRAADAGTETNASVNLWRSTAAINSISFTTNAVNIASGSTFTLYGIKAA